MWRMYSLLRLNSTIEMKICKNNNPLLLSFSVCNRDIIVIAGGVIPPQDYDELYASGCAAIFGPGL